MKFKQFLKIATREYLGLSIRELESIFNQCQRSVLRNNGMSVEQRIQYAVRSYVRHTDTEYEQLLFDGVPKQLARRQIQGYVKIREAELRYGQESED